MEFRNHFWTVFLNFVGLSSTFCIKQIFLFNVSVLLVYFSLWWESEWQWVGLQKLILAVLSSTLPIPHLHPHPQPANHHHSLFEIDRTKCTCAECTCRCRGGRGEGERGGGGGDLWLAVGRAKMENTSTKFSWFHCWIIYMIQFVCFYECFHFSLWMPNGILVLLHSNAIQWMTLQDRNRFLYYMTVDCYYPILLLLSCTFSWVSHLLRCLITRSASFLVLADCSIHPRIQDNPSIVALLSSF